MSKLPVPTAKDINDQHALARSTAETAVQHAIKCGQMLERKKAQLGHGPFGEWVRTYCDFSHRSARAYMQVAGKSLTQNGRGLPFSSINDALGYDKPKPDTNSPKGAVPVVKVPEGSGTTGETGNDRPAAPIPPPASPAVPPPPSEGEPEWTEADEAQYQDQEAAEAQRRIAAAMDADDRLAEAFAQIKQQGALLANAYAARDRAMNQAAEAVRLLKAAQAKIARLERELKKQRLAA